jgi:hypothetical protein
LLYSQALLTGDVRRVLSVEAADQRLLNTQAKKKAGIASRENVFFDLRGQAGKPMFQAEVVSWREYRSQGFLFSLFRSMAR